MLPITIGVVSYRSPLTLGTTLLSYNNNGLLAEVEERSIILQEPTEEQISWARKLGFQCRIEGNLGIGRATGELLKRCTSEYFLLLEEDWLLVEEQAKVTTQLEAGINLLRSEPEGVVRYRHRREYGEPLYSRQFQGRELSKPTHLGECIFWREDPDRDFPELIRKVSIGDEHFYRLSSRHSCYTNNPVLYRTEFAQRILLPFCFDDLETPMQSWWEQQDFAVFQGAGLFKHSRLDR